MDGLYPSVNFIKFTIVPCSRPSGVNLSPHACAVTRFINYTNEWLERSWLAILYPLPTRWQP